MNGPMSIGIRRDSCPICGEVARDYLRLDVFQVAECNACSFLFTREVLGADAMASFYKEGYGGERHRLGQKINAAVNVKVLNRLIRPGTVTSLLDVGCGYGYLLQEARRIFPNAECEGVELSAAERSYAREQLHLTIYEDLDALAPTSRYDVIALFEVIEHIPEPVSFLEVLKERLNPSGLIVVGTDNFRSAVVRRLGAGFPKWIPHQHVSLFDHKTLPATLRSIGLEVHGRLSFTPWEILARSLICRLTLGRLGGTSYRYTDQIHSENTRPFKMAPLRSAINARWAGMALSRKLSGEMMYVCALKG